MSRVWLNRYAASLVTLEKNPGEALNWVYENSPGMVDNTSKLAAWHYLRVAGDIFDEDLGSDIEDKKEEDVQVLSLDKWLEKQGLKGVKWFAVGEGRNYGSTILGREGSNLIVLAVVPKFGTPERWDKRLWKIPINKDSPKKIAEVLSEMWGYDRRFTWNLIDKLTEKNMKFQKGGDISTTDALAHGGVVKGKVNRVPVIDMIFAVVSRPNLQRSLDPEDGGTALPVANIAINGRVWSLDPSTIRNMSKGRLFTVLRKNAKAKDPESPVEAININKNNRLIGSHWKGGNVKIMSRFCNWVLRCMTREESSLFIALAQAEEFFDALEEKNGEKLSVR